MGVEIVYSLTRSETAAGMTTTQRFVIGQARGCVTEAMAAPVIVNEAARRLSIVATALDKLVVASAVTGLAVVVDAETESVEDADADDVEGTTVLVPV